LAALLNLAGDLTGAPARSLVGRLFRCALAVLHSPQYQQDHQDSLAQDWAHLPIPSDPAGFDRLVEAGDKVATLLDPSVDADQVITALVGADRVKHLGVVRRRSGGPVDSTDLAVTVSYYGAAKGDWKPRAFSDEEQAPFEWGDNTGDLYINGEVYFANVPVAVWRFELGGYPTLKKWLGYRQANRRGGHPLTLAEAHHLRSMIQRLAALLTLHQQLDQLYGAASALSLTAEDLGLRV
jgi:hypothetical protein